MQIREKTLQDRLADALERVLWYQAHYCDVSTRELEDSVKHAYGVLEEHRHAG